MRKLWWVLLVIVVLALAVWLNEIPAHASEGSYVKYLRSLGGSEMFSDDDLLAMGHNACDAIKSKGSVTAAVDFYAAQTPFPRALVQVVTDAAHVHLCPDLGK